ncbi:hypothetical protein B1B04_10445 [Lysinibacillus sp. KCTC 33748]|uniref:hypothetical protein n=1 Tax=unclassified Lysinibacillus TaxID=2636778 RepID=UPI0009A66A9D|nr:MULTISPECIES: hypothetical protein [unclassified Lysinibacillus]OXS74024.1 hypothetical protein B1B04_10445 [Lysinibacillus sp. KCTC 33748]SKB69359.1 hypothetical protein SAMN06295926_10647 [Lysinibacillus sp. AC-3]
MINDENLRKFSLLVFSLMLLLVYVLSSGFALDGIGRYELRDLRFFATIHIIMYFASIIGYIFLLSGWVILYSVLNNVLKSFSINESNWDGDDIGFMKKNKKLVGKLNLSLYFLIIFWALNILYLISTAIRI